MAVATGTATHFDAPAIERELYMRTFARQPITLVRGEGVRVWDDTGREYLDFLAGVAVNALGHCAPAIVEAITAQASTLIHTSNIYHTVPQLELARLLIDNSCLDRIFYANSGAEANECAIKLARKWGKLHRDGAFEIITALGSFHGRTLASLAATGNRHYQEAFDPMPEGFRHVPFNDLEAMRAAITPKVAAVMLEPVLGEGGIHPATVEYLHGVRKLCDHHGILLILDEVQSGIGRMGYLYGYEAYGIEPDVITLAKGLGGGLPIAACLAKEHAAVFTPGDHGSTYSGSPLVCAAALAVVRAILDTDLLANVRAMTDHLHAGLKSLQAEGDVGISEIRVSGLWMGIEFDEDRAGAILDKCRNDGLLVNRTSANTIRIAPPLIVTRDDCDRFLDIFGRACAR
jgi:acetylornithine/N-succinyldiaminopimelate aminotransferase